MIGQDRTVGTYLTPREQYLNPLFLVGRNVVPTGGSTILDPGIRHKDV